jgi:hypothetical protein
MFGSAVMEVALGLAVMFSVLTTVCSGVREFFARTLSEREEMLAKAVYRMLGSEPPAGGSAWNPPAALDNLPAKVLNHQLVRSMGKSGDTPPSYLPARTFALAVLHILSPGELEKDMDGLKKAIADLPEATQHILSPIVAAAGGKVEAFRDGLERHFDHAMDRVSGWYKRRSQSIILRIAGVVAVGANIDTIHVAQHLYRNPTARQQLVAHAAGTAKLEDYAGLQSALELPVGWWRTDLPHDWKAWTFWGVGCLLTVLASTLGAPFWFDLLSRIVNLRSAGPVPPRS